MLRKFRAITQVFLIPLGPWNTKNKVLCVRILGTQNVPGSRSIFLNSYKCNKNVFYFCCFPRGHCQWKCCCSSSSPLRWCRMWTVLPVGNCLKVYDQSPTSGKRYPLARWLHYVLICIFCCCFFKQFYLQN